MKQQVGVNIPGNIHPPPERHEIEVAWILARQYGCVVEFLRPIDGYKTKTADIVMNGVMWEMKSPIGSSKSNTLKSQFKKAARQSRFMIVDGRRTKLEDAFVIKQIQAKISSTTRLKKIIFISKQGKVLEFLKFSV